MTESETNLSQEVLEKVRDPNNLALGITGSPSNTLEIIIDITEKTKTDRTLGQMVCVVVEEDKRNILVIGQIIEIETSNRWHEDPAFKGVIKRHGSLPHLSGAADNRVAKISVQACYDLGSSEPEGHTLGTSPSTGEKVQKMNNDIMSSLMKGNQGSLTYMGKVFGTNVDLPFWFKHFDKNDDINKEYGANDAYHIGVFGKTGSGKTVTAAMMLLGYAKNKHNLSTLVLDPQKQFYLDNNVLPQGVKFEEKIKEFGLNYEKYSLLEDVCLPGNLYELFAELLVSNGFIKKAFYPIYTEEKEEAAKLAILDYFVGRSNHPAFSLNNLINGKGSVTRQEILKEMLESFATVEEETVVKNKKEVTKMKYSTFVTNIYGTPATQERLVTRIKTALGRFASETEMIEKWEAALEIFSANKKTGGGKKIQVDEIVRKTVSENGNFIVLDLSPKDGGIENENLQALFVKLIEERIVEAGAKLYASGEKANCLIVMDEAHRFISKDSSDVRIKELTHEIIGSVRTTRKYGIGYMFITQTIESLDDEILRQMRIFAFGYGLTSGSESRKVGEIINNSASLQLYKSFIDPSSNHKYPFMFFGPISPLSFTGSPLFMEVYKDFSSFK